MFLRAVGRDRDVLDVDGDRDQVFVGVLADAFGRLRYAVMRPI
jgi:hypothetical protein